MEIVPTSPKHAELWHQWRGEPDARRFNPMMVTDLAGLRERMKTMSSDLSDLKGAREFHFFIRAKLHDGNADVLVGTLSLRNVDHTMLFAEIGYGIGHDFQGRGYATSAVGAFVRKIFDETSLRRLIAHVAEGNVASRRVLEKVGFIQEGICREHFLINGTPTNEVLYGILRSDLKNRD